MLINIHAMEVGGSGPGGSTTAAVCMTVQGVK